jgi:NAD(P)-dependent dehydrogenase (short-subunit alcohol dehydrogenase family)
MSDFNLRGKVVLITGGNSGIGLASARLFKAEGASLVLVGQNLKTLEAARSELGGDTLAIQANVAKIGDLDHVMKKVQTQHGRIDVLFANAGISHCPPLEETDEAAFDHIVDINLKGVFFTFTRALPLLSEGASVIFTSSAAHDMGKLGDPLYSATKAAVRSLVRTFAASEAARGKKLRVNAITPGCVKTPLTEAASCSPEITAYLESVIPMGRWGEADEIARAVLFLASNQSSYMTGAEIAVDGGLAQI